MLSKRITNSPDYSRRHITLACGTHEANSCHWISWLHHNPEGKERCLEPSKTRGDCADEVDAELQIFQNLPEKPIWPAADMPLWADIGLWPHTLKVRQRPYLRWGRNPYSINSWERGSGLMWLYLSKGKTSRKMFIF